MRSSSLRSVVSRGWTRAVDDSRSESALPEPAFWRRAPAVALGHAPIQEISATVLTREMQCAPRADRRESSARRRPRDASSDIAAMGPMTYVGGAPVMDYRVHSASAVHHHFLDWQKSLDMIFDAPVVRDQFDSEWTERAPRKTCKPLFVGGFVAVMFLRGGQYEEARRVLIESLLQEWRTPASVGSSRVRNREARVPQWFARRVGIAVAR